MKVEVKSSAIKAIEYDDNTQILRITFTQGRTYDYPAVPRNEVDQLIAAPSVGKYFNTHIKQYAVKSFRG